MAVSAASFAALGAGAVYGPYGASQIEAKYQTRASATLKDAGVSWAKTRAEGRRIILSGEAPDERARADAVKALESASFRLIDVKGVRVRPPVPIADYAFEARLEGQTLKLTGLAPSNAAKEMLTNVVRAHPSIKFEDKTKIERHLEEAAWSKSAEATLSALLLLDQGLARNDGKSFLVAGVTHDPIAAATAEGLIAGVHGPFELSARIARTGNESDQAALAAAKHCQARINSVTVGQSITFEQKVVALTEQAKATLNAVIDVVKECGEVRLSIEGHSDSEGDLSDNVELSLARAVVVMTYVTAGDLPFVKFETRGWGEARPIASNRNETGRRRNRRVDFVVRPTGAKGSTE